MGSNLNLSGEIECDASIMDGKSLHYGAVGAISGELPLPLMLMYYCGVVQSPGLEPFCFCCFYQLAHFTFIKIFDSLGPENNRQMLFICARQHIRRDFLSVKPFFFSFFDKNL